jgi:hypothetical protein
VTDLSRTQLPVPVDRVEQLLEDRRLLDHHPEQRSSTTSAPPTGDGATESRSTSRSTRPGKSCSAAVSSPASSARSTPVPVAEVAEHHATQRARDEPDCVDEQLVDHPVEPCNSSPARGWWRSTPTARSSSPARLEQPEPGRARRLQEPARQGLERRHSALRAVAHGDESEAVTAAHRLTTTGRRSATAPVVRRGPPAGPHRRGPAGRSPGRVRARPGSGRRGTP